MGTGLKIAMYRSKTDFISNGMTRPIIKNVEIIAEKFRLSKTSYMDVA